MMELITSIKELGAFSINYFWLPVALWTFLAGLAALGFGYLKRLPSVYQYHGRVAILWSLPIGILCSILLYRLTAIYEASAAASTKFIVIQNPISITAAATEQPFYALSPTFLLGVASILGAAVALVALIKLAVNIITLKSFAHKIDTEQTATKDLLSEKNQLFLKVHCPKTSVVFSTSIEIPCTFGWNKKWVVLPEAIRKQPQKVNIAVRHELMHIQQYDYLLNATLQAIKALFYFHPLVHLLVKDATEQRELYCDQNVLADPEISQKQYAELLFELAPKQVFRTSAAVSMAVNPSTLKKRIQIMKTQATTTPSIKRSITFMLITGLLFSGIMACSDMEENGITNTEVEQAQSKINTSEKEPLYVLDGQKVQSEEMQVKLSRIKPEYIESINVLKGDKATEEFGTDGENGVVKIKLIDRDRAFGDLVPDTPPAPPSRLSKAKDEYYVKVDNRPTVIGGITSVQKNVTYPQKARNAKIEGRVIVRFIVDEQGEVKNASVIRGIGGGCDEEALRVVKQAKFKPGTQNGHQVPVQMSIPIVFKL